MADPSEILNVIAGQAAAIAYPSGTSSASITNGPIKIYAGWPVPPVLQADINAGGVHITVYPLTTERKMTTALGRPYRQVTAGDPTILAAVSGSTVTLSGFVSTPQNVYFLIDGIGYHYSVQTGDTLTTIATAMATIIPASTNAGPVITISGAHEIIARTGGVGTAARELRRQAKDFMVTIWAPTPQLRDIVGSALDSGLSVDSNISLSDGLPSFIVYARSMYSDASENYLVYRRDLVYTVNYATSQVISAPQVVAPVLTTNGITQNI